MTLIWRMLVALPRTLATRGPVRRSLLLSGTLSALCLALAALSIPAYAFVEEVETTKVGLQPREISRYWEGSLKWKGLGKLESEANPAAYSFNNPAGHPVMHSASTYAIYWDPQDDYYHGDWQGLIDGFLANLAGGGGQLDNVFAVDAQYTDATDRPAADRSTFLGAYTDTTPYPAAGCADPHPFVLGAPLLEEHFPVCLTDGQIKTQLQAFIAQHDLRTGMGTIFYLLTPPGVAVCLDAGGATGHCSEFEGSITEVEKDEEEKIEPSGYKSYKNSFCSYHDAIGAGSESTILYAVIPWTAGGDGDNHLAQADSVPAYDCQDGGFEPGTKPNGEIEEKENPKKEHTAKEKEEFEKKTKQEQREQEEAEALGLGGPHEQEPNQLNSARGPDGSYDTGLADLIINQIGIEQQDTVTDPLLDAWQDTAGNEVTDECRNFFAPTPLGSVSAVPTTKAGTLANDSLGDKTYYLNDAFDLAALKLDYPGIRCLNDVSLLPQFTAPVNANAGEVVGFDGMESNLTLDAGDKFSSKGTEEPNYAIYSWNFGDGSPAVTGYAPGAPSANPPATLCEEPWLTPCAASTFHSYTYGGTYQVTLTVTDVGGNTASVTEPITVVGPPPPPPPGSGGSGSAGASSGTTTPGGSGGSGTSASTLPRPIAAAAAVASSLKQVARSGLLVHYSVNEQVAGRFEVLLSAASAHRLGISGPLATNLPAGSPQSLVIGHALLVTTKGGRSSVRIKFSKSTAKRLRRAHKVTLMLRMVVRNASIQSPLFTTVLSTVVLHR